MVKQPAKTTKFDIEVRPALSLSDAVSKMFSRPMPLLIEFKPQRYVLSYISSEIEDSTEKSLSKFYVESDFPSAVKAVQHAKRMIRKGTCWRGFAELRVETRREWVGSGVIETVYDIDESGIVPWHNGWGLAMHQLPPQVRIKSE